MKKPKDSRAFKKAFWKSISTFIGVFMGAGAGSMLHQVAGDRMKSMGVGIILAIISWILIFYSEYKREEKV